MYKTNRMVIIFLVLFILMYKSCIGDPSSNTEIGIINNSSYDLIVDLKKYQHDEWLVYLESYKLLKNELVIIHFIKPLSVRYEDPNSSYVHLKFRNLATDEIIKELESNGNDGKNYFEFVRSKNEKSGVENAIFKLVITDELLDV